MVTASIRRFSPLLALLLCLFSVSVFAMPEGDPELASKMMGRFFEPSTDAITAAATYLFWSLATISLVWTMGVILLRGAGFGELFLELIRFIFFTGLFYWLLENVSGDKGFIYNIFDSFKMMGGAARDAANGGLGDSADSLISIGRNIFYRVIDQMQNAEASDTIVLAAMSLIILAALTLVTAQMVLIVIMAWMLAYGGIFLLGFGGARWTSLIAINYYKHAVAVGIALLALLMLMNFGFDFLNKLAIPLMDKDNKVEFIGLADMFVVALIMAVLGIKLPSLLYTLVTGSPLGLLAGTASMAGTAIMTGGGGAIATATASMAQHTSSRRENHHATAMDAFRNVSPDMQRGDTYQMMSVGGSGLGAANGLPQVRTEGNVFGGPPPVGVWNSGAAGQPAVQSQAPAQASAQNAQESKAGAEHTPVATDSGQEMLRNASRASVNERADESVQRGLIGAISDQTESQLPSDTHSLGQATSAATSSSEQIPSGGFQPAALQHSPAAVADGNQLGQAASVASSGASQTSVVGTQPLGLLQPASSAGSNMQQAGQAVSAASSVAQTLVGGFQPAALSPATAQREGAQASIQSGTPLPLTPASPMQNVKKTRSIKRKTEVKQKTAHKREASIDPGMIGSNHRVDGQPAETDVNDEVAAFRDRRPRPTDNDAGGNA